MSSSTDPIAFGRWLKRQRAKISQGALALRAGCAPSMLQKIEQGLRRPSRELAERLAATKQPVLRADASPATRTPAPAALARA